MKLLAYSRSVAAKCFHPSQTEADMEEELRSHIQHRADDLERSGLDRAEANAARVSSSAAASGPKRNAVKHSAAISSRL
jgi:hypothetical protein